MAPQITPNGTTDNIWGATSSAPLLKISFLPDIYFMFCNALRRYFLSKLQSLTYNRPKLIDGDTIMALLYKGIITESSVLKSNNYSKNEPYNIKIEYLSNIFFLTPLLEAKIIFIYFFLYQ